MQLKILGSFILLLLFVAVAPAAEYYVSPKGSDEYAGTKNRPFRTIQKAADVMTAGDTCYVREGVYLETVTLKKSGAEGKPIRFVAWPGEVITLSGAEPIKADWSVYKGSIYKAEVNRAVGQLFVDGKMMIEARWPNARFEELLDRTKWAFAGKGSEYGKMVDPELAKTGINWNDAVATLHVGLWETWRRRVLNHSLGSDSFEYERNLHRRLENEGLWRHRHGAGRDCYYLSGKLEALDIPTEWYLDAAKGMLYLWTPDGRNPAEYRVEGKIRDYTFEVSECSYIEISGFHFFAATFKFENCDNCVVDGCHLLYPACRQGLKAAAPTLVSGSHNIVRNCSAGFSDSPGAMMKGTENTLENCLIHDVSWDCVSPQFGIYMGDCNTSVIRRCTVFNMGGGPGIAVPRQDSVVEYNYVHHGGFTASDGALIQCSGSPLVAGTEIRYNWVHDHYADGGWVHRDPFPVAETAEASAATTRRVD